MTRHVSTTTSTLQAVPVAADIQQETPASFTQTCIQLDPQDRFDAVAAVSEADAVNTRLSQLAITGLAVASLCGLLGRHYQLSIDADFAQCMIVADPSISELLQALQDRPPISPPPT